MRPRPLPLSQQRRAPARARLLLPRVRTLRRLPGRLQMLQITMDLSHLKCVAVQGAMAPPCALT